MGSALPARHEGETRDIETVAGEGRRGRRSPKALTTHRVLSAAISVQPPRRQGRTPALNEGDYLASALAVPLDNVGTPGSSRCRCSD